MRGLIHGTRWLRDETRQRIMDALDWPPGELSRRVWGGRVALEDVATPDLVRELCHRLNHDPDVRD